MQFLFSSTVYCNIQIQGVLESGDSDKCWFKCFVPYILFYIVKLTHDLGFAHTSQAWCAKADSIGAPCTMVHDP